MYLKQEIIRDRKYLDSFKDRRCVVCGNPDAVAHHILLNNNSKGKGLKPSDSDCISLCVKCHSECHQGERKFYNKYWYVWNGNVLKFARDNYNKYLLTNK